MPNLNGYIEQFPRLSAELAKVLPSIMLLEKHAAAYVPEHLCTPPPPPREIGDFTIVREVGRGGMGVVYEATQQSLGRHVALKVLSLSTVLNEKHLERFQFEAAGSRTAATQPYCAGVRCRRMQRPALLRHAIRCRP